MTDIPNPGKKIQMDFDIMYTALEVIIQNAEELKNQLNVLKDSPDEPDAKRKYMGLKKRMGQLVELLQKNITEIQDRKDIIDGSK